MKIIRLLIASAAFVLPWFMLGDARAADVSVGVQINSIDDFNGPLSAHGSWVEVGNYGRCWRPYGVDASWRPYCDGTWVWTDQGWYWQSDEPWSWACYHYGRWTDDPYYGWCWAPDTVWGPSWVCFREGGGYCGWAPLPPGAVFGPGGGFAIGVIPNEWFVFVGERHFGERVERRNVIVNNTTIINRTTINTRIRRENNRVINEGPRVQDLQRVNHERIQTGNIQTLRQHEKGPTIVHRPPPVERENVQPIERPANELQREAPRPNEPPIIRGPPSTPAPPPPERQEPREAPPQNQQHLEQRPAGPPAVERVAPPKPPPPHEEPHEAPHEEPRGADGK